MEGLYNNSTSLNQSSDYSNISSNYQTLYISLKIIFITEVVTYIIIAISLLLILVAIYALYSMVRSDHVVPFYAINLLIADILQICSLIALEAKPHYLNGIFSYMYFSGLIASVYFMVCIALERYPSVCPVCVELLLCLNIILVYNSEAPHRLCVHLVVWVLSLVYVLYHYFVGEYQVAYIIFTVLILLLPFPLLIFFLVGTLKALYASISVPSDEKCRIVGILVLVLLIYTLLFLPTIILFLGVNNGETLYNVSFIFLRLSPLADLVLYVFMRKGFIDKLLASVCCCRMDSKNISSPSV